MNVFVAILVLLPVAFLAAAAVAAMVSVRRSSLRITATGVEFRNYPQPEKTVPLELVARFEPTAPSGNLPSVRPATGVLVLTDGSRLPIRCISEPEAGHGIDALNARVELLRRDT